MAKTVVDASAITVLVLDRKVPVARITPIAQVAAAGHKMTDEERAVLARWLKLETAQN